MVSYKFFLTNLMLVRSKLVKMDDYYYFCVASKHPM